MVVVASVVGAVVLVAGLCMQTRGTATAAGPVYTVAQVQALLAHQPRAWTSRTLLLRGVAATVGCWVYTADSLALCVPPRMVLGDADPAAAVAPFPLAWAGPDPLLALVRRVPVLGGFVPAPQAAQPNAVTTYRVRFRAVSDEWCGATCYEAVLLDALPP
jgi:hypothetical protein